MPQPPEPRRANGSSGFSIIEALAATTLLAVALVALAQLIVIATGANSRARTITRASVLAEEKLEQLRGLAWGFDPLGLPVSDLTSDLAVAPEQADGGFGLTPSPPGVLARDTRGYCDFVDADGHTIGRGDAAPPNAVYVRRWSIEPLTTSPDTIVLQVVVMRVAGGPVASHMVTVRTRKYS